ncbi:MAG: glycine zipper family protein [Luteimonas sp.]
MIKSMVIAVVLVASAAPLAAWAQKPSVYPANGQSAEKKNSDDAQCLSSAQQDTGIDPAAVAAAPAPATGPQGERLRGAARGAAAGAVVGEVTGGDAREGAGAGAAVGVVAGGRRSRQNQAAQAQNAQAANGQAIDTYYRSYAACMQGRGYTVQ